MALILLEQTLAREVLAGHDATELAAHFVRGCVDLAQRLFHDGFGRQIFDSADQRVGAPADDPLHSMGQTLGHVPPRFLLPSASAPDIVPKFHYFAPDDVTPSAPQ